MIQETYSTLRQDYIDKAYDFCRDVDKKGKFGAFDMPKDKAYKDENGVIHISPESSGKREGTPYIEIAKEYGELAKRENCPVQSSCLGTAISYTINPGEDGAVCYEKAKENMEQAIDEDEKAIEKQQQKAERTLAIKDKISSIRKSIAKGVDNVAGTNLADKKAPKVIKKMDENIARCISSISSRGK